MQDARCRNAVDCKLPGACCLLTTDIRNCIQIRMPDAKRCCLPIANCLLPVDIGLSSPPVIRHLSSVHFQLLLVVRGPWSFFSFHPNILLNIQPLYPKIFNFLYSALNKCIVLDLYSKSEIMSLPFPGAAIFQMLSIRTIL